MNNFRSKVLSGAPVNESLLRAKTARNATDGSDGESLERVSVPRAEIRRADHRADDRHRLSGETAVARWRGEAYTVELVNLSGGGAMIAGDLHPKLWDRIDLTLGECGTIETAVRWIRQDRIGLEFAHETRIEADADTLDSTLRAVIARSFPDVAIELGAHRPEADIAPQPKPAEQTDEDIGEQAERSERHPLIWMGLIHFNHDTSVVRLRNISMGGALVESSVAFPVGADLLLDLQDAGTHFATVHWARGDQAGLRFHAPFDLAVLAHCQPKVAPAQWSKPDYLRDETSSSSPWAAEWGRLSLTELQKRLGL